MTNDTSTSREVEKAATALAELIDTFPKWRPFIEAFQELDDDQTAEAIIRAVHPAMVAPILSHGDGLIKQRLAYIIEEWLAKEADLALDTQTYRLCEALMHVFCVSEWQLKMYGHPDHGRYLVAASANS
jgi:hypothetical protein